MSDTTVDTDVEVRIPVGLHARLSDLAGATGSSVEAEVAAAATRHLEVHAGRPGPPGAEFRKVGSDREAEVLLRQCTEATFWQAEPFTYDDGHRRHEVPERTTDLASVPQMLTWLVPRYGRHTLPALLHDCLQEPERGVTSWDADVLFRDSMRATGVPFVRRWAMFCAVALRSLILKERGPARWWRALLLLVWVGGYGIVGGIYGWTRMATEVWDASRAMALGEAGAIAAAGLLVVWQDSRKAGWPVARALLPWTWAAVVLGAVAIAVVLGARDDTWMPAVMLAVLVSPVVLGGFWGPRAHRVGLIAGVALVLAAIPIVLVAWAVLVYRALEGVAARVAPGANPVTVRDWQEKVEAAGSQAGAAAPPAS